jgi:hypothetical protein
MRESKAVAADVMRLVAGDKSAVLLSLLVCVAALTTMNAAIFTGARTNYAMGRDFALFGKLGHWREAGSTPANALLLQGAISLLLVLASSFTPDGFTAMVAYTSPVFWTFFLLTALTLFVFRRRGGEAPAFRVPLYPIVRLHALFEHQLRALRRLLRRAGAGGTAHHGRGHTALLPYPQQDLRSFRGREAKQSKAKQSCKPHDPH